MSNGNPDWWRDALCTEIGVEIFFPITGSSGGPARKICALCEVRVDCLVDALTWVHEEGIFAGTGRDERRHLQQRINKGEDPWDVAREAVGE